MKRTICEECGGKIKYVQMEDPIYGPAVGPVETMICTKCGEICYDGEVIIKIEFKAKKLGLLEKQKLSA